MASRQSLIRQLRQLPNRTNGATPILAARLGEIAAYVVVHPGCYCSIGGIHLPDGKRSEDTLLAGKLLNLLIDEVSREVELVQAIANLDGDDGILETCYAVAGLKRVAVLRQMACDFTADPISDLVPECFEHLRSSQSIQYIPWEPCVSDSFLQIVDRTYVDTLDVPELNGVRETKHTLAGYAACLSERERPWWILRKPNGQDVGCLLLCPYSDFAELVYVGLVPESRGLGYSRSVVRFSHRWAKERGLGRVVLAVDQRNEPAIRLYRSFGYETTGSVVAWMRPTRSVMASTG